MLGTSFTEPRKPSALIANHIAIRYVSSYFSASLEGEVHYSCLVATQTLADLNTVGPISMQSVKVSVYSEPLYMLGVNMEYGADNAYDNREINGPYRPSLHENLGLEPMHAIFKFLLLCGQLYHILHFVLC